MPIYEYKCAVCEHRFSVLQRIGEGNDHLCCEKCGALRPVKQFSTFASSISGGKHQTFASTSAPGGRGFT